MANGRLQALLERIERPMLLLAGVSIFIHLGDLIGLWTRWGLHRALGVASVAVDLAFVLDLGLKIAVERGPYLRSAWFFIDLVATMPVLAALVALPGHLEDLRVLRGLRVFRTLRMLRVMRTLRLLQVFKWMDSQSPEGKAFDRALYAAVVLYTAAFLGLMGAVHQAWAPGGKEAQEVEFFVVTSSLLGMGVILGVVRYQIPDISHKQIRALLNLALPHQVAEHFLHHPESYDATVRMPATIVFSDIRGFSRQVEALGADLTSLKQHLEIVLDTLVEAHQKYDLIVDKFIGDAVMSFRGGNLVSGDPGEHAWRVVRASLESSRRVKELGDEHFNSVKIGGASSSECLIGTFGTSRRLSYTVLGDAVNLAARLEPASGQAGADNLFCEMTWRLTKDRADLVWRRFGKLRVPGKERAVDCYEAFDAGTLGERGFLSRFEEGLCAFEARRIEEARALFLEADRLRPGGDPPSRFYAERCERLLRAGVPAGWEPVIETHK